MLDVLDHRRGIRVDDDDVVGALVHPRKHFAGATRDEPDTRGCDAGIGEVLARMLLVLVLGVDRGEHRVTHRLQHPEPRDAHARTDLDDGFGPRGCGDHGELSTDCRRHGFDAELDGQVSGPQDRIGLDDGLIDVFPVQVSIGHVGSR